MPGVLGAAVLDDVHSRLWSTNDMGSYKYISLRERQWNGPWQVTWYADLSGQVLPSAFFPLTAERAVMGMMVDSTLLQAKLRFVRYEPEHDGRPIWEVPIAAGSYTMTVESDGVQGGTMTIRRESNGHALVLILNQLGLPDNGFVIGDANVASSVLVNPDGFAYVTKLAVPDGQPPVAVVTRSWSNLQSIASLTTALANGF